MTTARTGRGNRYGLALVGLLLAAGGAASLTVGLGVFGTGRAHAALFTPAESRYVDGSGWFWPVVAAAAAVAGLACLRWLFVQTRRDRVGTLHLEADHRRGTTRVGAHIATDALETEIGSYPGVTHARGRLTGSTDALELVLTIGVAERADLADLRTKINTEAVAHLREALGEQHLPTRLALRLDTTSARRHLT